MNNHRRSGLTVAAGALLGGALLSAQAAPPSFRFERPLVSDAGPHRFPVDVPLLAGGTAFRVLTRIDPSTGEVSATAVDGLADLRLFDPSGREVPYLLMAKPSAQPVWRQSSAILPVAVVETETLKTSGFEVDLGESVTIDRFRIEGLSPPFLKRVRLEGSGDREHWAMLIDEGTLFDLPDEKLQQMMLRFAPGSFRYFRLTWDDTRSGRVAEPQSISVRLTTDVVPPPPLTTALAFERRPSEPGRSHLRVRLPAGRLPIVALELDVAETRVLREATVSQPRLAGDEVIPAVIGRSTLRRAELGSLAASSLRIPIAALTEAELDLIVDDGSNPPLDVRGITAIFAELPWVYVESDGAALVARYGNATLRAPKYDLEAVRTTLRIDRVPEGRWGEARGRTAEENAEAPPLPVLGPAVDASLFRYVRPVPEAATGGLVALRLDAAVLAHSRGVDGRFRDVRVIDRSARQVPYLVERSSEPQSLNLTVVPVADQPPALGAANTARSVYRIEWPYDHLPSPRLILRTSARVFTRPVSAVIERTSRRQSREPQVQTLASARWVHADQSTPAPELTLPLPDFAARDVFIVVDEGDNTALPLVETRLLLPAYRLRFFREPDAPLRLVYGRPDLDPPRYDLALLAPQLLGAPAEEIAAEAEPGAAAEDSAFIGPRMFWSLLAAAVVVLIALIVKLVRDQTV